jgi:hypothetical protein
MRREHWRKLTSDKEESQYRNYDLASGAILIISKSIQRSKQNLFYLRPDSLKVLKPAAHEHKVQIQF